MKKVRSDRVGKNPGERLFIDDMSCFCAKQASMGGKKFWALASY